jgi:drug/metabolite transporter (DMT)-like permease
LASLAKPCKTVGGIWVTYSPTKGVSLSKGDLLTFLCAFFFALHISYLDIVSKKVNVIKMTFMQMATATFLSLIVFGLFDHFTITNVDFSKGFISVLYLGLFSTCLCFLIQTFAQKQLYFFQLRLCLVLCFHYYLKLSHLL